MARVRKGHEAAERAKQAAIKVIRGRELLGPMVKPSRKAQAKERFARQIGRAQAKKYVVQIDAMIEAGEYDMTPRLWVALFCWLHEAVYGVECIDETRMSWGTASTRANAMLNEEFEGNEDEFMSYLRWVALEEERIEAWRRTNGKQGKRLNWRDLFLYKTKLSDYRLARLRTKGIA